MRALDNRSARYYLEAMSRNPPENEALAALVSLLSQATNESDDSVAVIQSWDKEGPHGLTYGHLRHVLALATDHGAGGPYRAFAIKEISKVR